MSHDSGGPSARNVITVAELAAALGIGRRLAYQLISDGKIRHVRVGRAIRIPSTELARFLGVQLSDEGEYYSVELLTEAPSRIGIEAGARIWTTDPVGFEGRLVDAGVAFARTDPTLVLDGPDGERLVAYRIG